MKLPRLIIRLALSLALLGTLFAAAPLQAQAMPPINPVCWIADQRNPAVKENCKGHNWNWPHWGGRSNSDGPDRGCGGSNIYSQAWWMSADEISKFNYGNLRGRQGIARSELVLLGSYQNRLRFRHDEMIHSWQVRVTSWVWYDGVGWMTWYTPEKTYTVRCDMNGHVK